MGNRAVITTEKNWANDGVGIYLHWNGGRDSVEAFLKYCDLKRYRSPSDDCYGWARLCQVIGNFFGGNTSVGIDTLWHLDCNNFDNGVYIIDGWEIVDRRYHEGPEQNEYDMQEMLEAIDKSMPEEESIMAYLKAKEADSAEIGDTVVFINWNGELVETKVIGIGEDRIVNGRNVKGVPFVGEYGLHDDPAEYANNINNYLDGKKWRKVAKWKGVTK